MTTQELVERLNEMTANFVEFSQTSNNNMHRRLYFNRAEVSRAAASRLSEMHEALMSVESWLTRWGSHVAHCRGYPNCTCGLDAMRHEARAALEHQQKGEAND